MHQKLNIWINGTNNMNSLFDKLKDTTKILKNLTSNIANQLKNDEKINSLKTELEEKLNNYNIPLILQFNKNTLNYLLVEKRYVNLVNSTTDDLDNANIAFSISDFCFDNPDIDELHNWFEYQILFCEVYKLLTTTFDDLKFNDFDNHFYGNIIEFHYNFCNFSIYLDASDKNKISKLQIEYKQEDDSFRLILDKYKINFSVYGHGRDEIVGIFSSEITDFPIKELPDKMNELIQIIKNLSTIIK